LPTLRQQPHHQRGIQDATERPYADLPRLTPAEFDTLAVAARQWPSRGGRPISAWGLVLARAVLVDGVTYREAERALGFGYSVAARAVAALLRYRDATPMQHQSVPLHDPFGRFRETAARGDV